MKTWLGDLLADLGVLGGKFFNALKEAVVDPDLLPVLFVCGIVLSLAGGVLGCIFMSVTADDRILYCTVERDYANGYDTRQQYFRVIGHRDWRSDVVVADMPRLDWAVQLTESGVCNQ